MIPKIIHYCWFGNIPIPKDDKTYIQDWHRICPNFKFKRWSEDNFNYSAHRFTKIAYQTKSWAALSDYTRLYALAHYGGIYLDCDVKLLKSLAPLLKNDAFIGMENPRAITNGLIFGASKHNRNVINLLHIYNAIAQQPHLKQHLNDQVYIVTAYFLHFGFRLKNQKQLINDCQIYPTDYFCPIRLDKGLQKHLTKNTYSIHTYDNSWQSNKNSDRQAIFNHDFPAKISYYQKLINNVLA